MIPAKTLALKKCVLPSIKSVINSDNPFACLRTDADWSFRVRLLLSIINWQSNKGHVWGSCSQPMGGPRTLLSTCSVQPAHVPHSFLINYIPCLCPQVGENGVFLSVDDMRTIMERNQELALEIGQ